MALIELFQGALKFRHPPSPPSILVSLIDSLVRLVLVQPILVFDQPLVGGSELALELALIILVPLTATFHGYFSRLSVAGRFSYQAATV